MIASSKKNQAEATYYVGFNINSNSYNYSTTSNTAEVLLTIKDNNNTAITSIEGLTYITSGGVSGFDITNKTGLFDVVLDKAISTTSSTTGTTHTWTFTLTFVNLSTDQSINENASMDIDILMQQDASFASFIKSKYVSGSESITGLYYHNSSLTNGASDNLYRIIGVFEKENHGIANSLVKLIKSDYANSNLLGTDGDYVGEVFALSNYSSYTGSLTTANKYYWNYNADTSINDGKVSNT